MRTFSSWACGQYNSHISSHTQQISCAAAKRRYWEQWTRDCCTRGCWHIITEIFGFRTLLTSQIGVPNKSPQCTNSIGTFERNFVLLSTIWIPTYWEIFLDQSIGVSERHISNNFINRNHVANLWTTFDTKSNCLLFKHDQFLKKHFFWSILCIKCRDVSHSPALVFSIFLDTSRNKHDSINRSLKSL